MNELDVKGIKNTFLNANIFISFCSTPITSMYLPQTTIYYNLYLNKNKKIKIFELSFFFFSLFHYKYKYMASWPYEAKSDVLGNSK